MNSRRTFRTGFVGTGYIADYHLAAIRRAGNVELVGVVDTDPEKAQSFAARAGTRTFDSIETLRDAGAEVVHVLTPPQTHASLAQRALRAGCHVLVEKPLAVDVADCHAIRRTEAETGCSVCVNHSLQFDPHVRSALDAVRRGKLGRVISMDILRSSVYPPYTGGPLPPHYRTAGYPFRDLGVHALYLFQAFLGPIENVAAQWQSLGGDTNLAFDEWRAQVRCRDGMGQFQLSWNTKPLQSQIIIQGTKGVLRVDLFLMSKGLRSSLPVPKAAERLLNMLADSVPMLLDVPRNVYRVLTKRALPYHGLQDLIRAFYSALENGQPMPVTVEDAIPVVTWVEAIARQADEEHQHTVQQFTRLHGPGSNTSENTAPILVTGASGSLGGAVARALQQQRESVRLFVRRPPPEVPPNTEVVLGNLGDPEAVERAVRGSRIVIHAGAATKGAWPEHLCATVCGTRNVLEACRKHGVEKLIYISSMSVLDWAGAPVDAVLDEASPLEPRAVERGAYTQAKLAAEQLVTDYVQQHRIPAIILRPGKIFGPRAPVLSAAIGFRLGRRWIVLGNGNVRIPFVHVDDVVDAVLMAASGPLFKGEIIQILGKDQPTQNEVLRICDPQAGVLHLPRFLVYTLGAMSQLGFKLLKRASPLSVYRLKSGLAERRFASRNALTLLGWAPRLGLADSFFASEEGDNPVEPGLQTAEPEASKESNAVART